MARDTVEGMTSLERTRAVISGGEVDRLPVQPMLMTFASRYAGIPFGDYCEDGRKMAAAQLKVMRDFDLDILLTCSDPTREVMDLGGERSVRWFEDQPPAIDEANAVLLKKSLLSALRQPDPLRGRLGDRVEAIRIMRREAGSGAVIVGWVEGALALAAELRGLNRIMLDLVDDPEFVDEVFAFAGDLAIRFAEAQIEAGADSIGMSDAAASLIGPEYYARYLLPQQERILKAVRKMGAMTRLHMCGNTNALHLLMKSLPVDVYELDFLTDIVHAREILGPTAVICGNIATIRTLLKGDADAVIAEAERCHQVCGPYHIVSPGCEVAPLTPPENVMAMVKYARDQAYCS